MYHHVVTYINLSQLPFGSCTIPGVAVNDQVGGRIFVRT